ncbi:MAG: hypothetical protein H7255_05880, partial [Ramlibacter sp.]|nr:hypothetical protein [Ramlibacter sp.]
MNIALNFINNSNDANNSQIVIFQKNVATDINEVAVAWQVIQNCGQGDHHPFTYAESMSVSAGDSYGNYTPELAAEHGQAFQMEMTASGHHLAPSGASTSANELQVLNNLPKGAISANVYRSGKLCA